MCLWKSIGDMLSPVNFQDVVSKEYFSMYKLMKEGTPDLNLKGTEENKENSKKEIHLLRISCHVTNVIDRGSCPH